MKRFVSSFAVLAAGLVLSGCSCHHLEEVSPQQVNNKTWMLTSMNGAAVSGPLVSVISAGNESRWSNCRTSTM